MKIILKLYNIFLFNQIIILLYYHIYINFIVNVRK